MKAIVGHPGLVIIAVESLESSVELVVRRTAVENVLEEIVDDVFRFSLESVINVVVVHFLRAYSESPYAGTTDDELCLLVLSRPVDSRHEVSEFLVHVRHVCRGKEDSVGHCKGSDAERVHRRDSHQFSVFVDKVLNVVFVSDHHLLLGVLLK